MAALDPFQAHGKVLVCVDGCYKVDWLMLVLDRVRHFQLILIHRFFVLNRYRYAS